jgi:hypothetical protein
MAQTSAPTPLELDQAVEDIYREAHQLVSTMTLNDGKISPSAVINKPCARMILLSVLGQKSLSLARPFTTSEKKDLEMVRSLNVAME